MRKLDLRIYSSEYKYSRKEETMAYFNYRNLDPSEFEALALDVMQRLLGCRLYRYAQGKDGGIDLCDNILEKHIVVQCKRYQQGLFDNLFSVLKRDEEPKLEKMVPLPEKYYVFTSIELLPQQKAQILDLFKDFMKNDESCIVDGIAINSFFKDEKNHDLIERNIKLFESFPENYKRERSEGKTALPKCLTNYVPRRTEIGLVGRDSVVKKVRAMLDDTELFVLVSGLGGIGKTAVMQEICNDILEDDISKNHVAWITCGDSLEDDLLVLRDQLGVPKDFSREDAYESVIRELQNFGGTLYLFMDDMARIPDGKELGKLNSLRPNVRIMITSRHEIGGIKKIDLTELEQGSAIKMFYGYYGYDEEAKYRDDARKIVESVNRHTLLIELLAKAAKQSFETLDVFRKQLEVNGFFGVSRDRLDVGKGDNTTIEDCVKKLYDISGLSVERQRIMSLFTAFTPEKEIYGKVVEWAGFDRNDVNDLVKLGWLSRTKEGFVIYQIVRDSLARQAEDGLKLEEYGDLLLKVADTDVYIPRDLQYTKVRERLVFTEDVARNLECRTKRMLETGDYKEKDISILVSSARLFHNMAGVYYEQGEYEKALEYYRKALTIRERVLGEEHPSTAMTYNNMASVYDMKEEKEKVLEYYDKALHIKEQVLGTEHPDTATTYNNMALVYSEQGEYEKALEYYGKARAIRERVLGTEHPSTATTYNDMALVYRGQGEYEKALEYYRKALTIRERVLGEEHPDTATTYNDMALVYSEQGEYEKALEYYRKALTIRERVLGTEHPSTATTYDNMAGVYEAQREYEKALELYEKALSVRMVKLGENHSYTRKTEFSTTLMKNLIERRMTKEQFMEMIIQSYE